MNKAQFFFDCAKQLEKKGFIARSKIYLRIAIQHAVNDLGVIECSIDSTGLAQENSRILPPDVFTTSLRPAMRDIMDN